MIITSSLVFHLSRHHGSWSLPSIPSLLLFSGGLEIRGKVRTKTQEIASKSVDCVLSVGALGRSGSASTEVVTEVFRYVREFSLVQFSHEVTNCLFVYGCVSAHVCVCACACIGVGEKRGEARRREEREETSRNGLNHVELLIFGKHWIQWVGRTRACRVKWL